MLNILDLVWTTDGTRCLGIKTNVMQHYYFDTNEEAKAFIDAHKMGDGELYFSPSLYCSGDRKQSNVKCVQALWLDIDCGEGKDYPTQQAGLDALAGFLKTTGFPVPYIINSGRGLHVYWVLSSPLAPDFWVTLARRLKTLCVLEGLKADPTRTADSASLLRPTGTYNRKTDTPLQVYFIKEGDECSVEDFQILLNSSSDDVVSKTITAGLEDRQFPDTDPDLILSKCQVLQDVVKCKGAVEEPLWRGMLSVIYRCTNGVKLIHDYSKGDKRYDFNQTLEKAQGTKGPYTCNEFANICPETCKNCPFRKTISSPIVLGMPTQTVEPTHANADNKGQDTSGRVTKTEHFDVTKKGVLLHSYTDEAKTFYISLVPIWVKSVREKVCREDEQGNSTLQLEWEDLSGRYRVATLPQSDLYDKKSLTKWLAENNLRAFIKGDVKYVQDYVSECIVEIMRLRLVEHYYETLGWNGDGFIWGKDYIQPTGTTTVALQAGSSITGICKKGNKDSWVSATSVFNNISYWPHSFSLLCSLASPLLQLCNYQSAVISLVGQSGYGKTLCASFALSVYGDPSLMTQAASTTLNACGVQMAAHKNLPYLLDEISTEPPYKIADFIYTAVNGRPKEVLDRSRNLNQGNGWCLVPFVTSNRSILEMSEASIQEAHRRRIIEVPFEAPITPVDANTLADALQNNCGSVAEEYLQYVVQHKEEIKSNVEKVLMSEALHDVPSANRFGKWTIACAAVAGSIAKKLGLIKFDPAYPVKQALHILTADSKAIKQDFEIAKSALSAYLYQNNGSINVWSSRPGAIDQTVVHSVVARFDPETDTFFMQRETFIEVVKEASVSMRTLKPWLAKANIRLVPQRLGSSLPIVLCYAFNKDAVGATIPQDLVS